MPDKLKAIERVCKIMGWDAPVKIADEIPPKLPTQEDIQHGIDVLRRWTNFAPRITGENIG